jgi:Protein of unknown function (DUF3995)
MSIIPAVLASSILCVLGVLHLYWAAGGAKGKRAAVPSVNGKPVLSPGVMGTALVAVGLFAVAAFIMVTANGSATRSLKMPLRVGTALIGLAFAARAIGDFRYVGFFKRVRDSEFAGRDTYIYSPLCLLLAGLIATVAVA